MTIRWKLFIGIFSFMLIALTVLGWLQIAVVGENLNSLMRARMNDYVQVNAGISNRSLEDFQSQVSFLADYLIQNAANENDAATEKLLKVISQRPNINSVFILFLDDKQLPQKQIGYRFNRQQGVAELQSPFPPEWFGTSRKNDRMAWFYEPLLKKDAFWSSISTRDGVDEKNQMILYHTRPVIVNGKVKALVGLTYNVNFVDKLVRDMKLSEKDYGVLFDQKLDFFYHPIFKQGTNLRTAYEGQFKQVADYLDEHSEKGSISYNWFDNRGKVFVYQKLINGWTLGMTVFSEELLVGKKLMPSMLLMGGGFTLVTAILLSLLLTLVVTSPLKNMISTLQEMSRGHYEVGVKKRYVGRRDEMGMLAVAIEKTRDLQKEHLDGLASYGELLESKVLERTEALSKAYENLECSLSAMEEKNNELENIRMSHSEISEQLLFCHKQIKRASDFAASGAMAAVASEEMQKILDNTASMAAYLKKEATATSEATHHLLPQNVEDGADIILQNMETMQRWTKDILSAQSNGSVKIHSEFDLRERLMLTVETFKNQFGDKMPETYVLCDPEETIVGDPVRFDQILHLLFADATSKRLDQVGQGHIYIRVEKKEHSKKLTFSHEGREQQRQDNLYLKTIEILMEEHFNGKMVCEEELSESSVCRLFF